MSPESTFQPSGGISFEFKPAVPIPPFLVGEIRAKLAYVDEAITHAEVGEERIRLTVIPQKGEALRAGEAPQTLSEERKTAIEEKVQRVVLSMARGAIPPKIQVLEDHLDRPVPYNQDPLPTLLRSREVFKETAGVFAFGPLLTRLIEFFENQFLALAKSFSAVPYRFPTLIPASHLERVHYFRAFPHSLTFVTHLREDLDVIDAFSQQAACDEGKLNTPAESFARVQALLSPAVCYHLYFALADRSLEGGHLAATSVGHCFRYEAINLTSLERLWDFTMREVIFVGDKEYVLDSREAARRSMAGFFERIGMAYRVESATDPFFIGEFRRQAAFQSAFQLKYEVRARLPYKESTLAVGSYNYHQDFFGRSLNITLPDGSPAHTGCVAFGLERLALAFLSQFGLDLEFWPEEVRRSVSAE